MRVKSFLLKGFSLFIAATLFFGATTSCGTILHPERRGRTSGRIDPGIAILDGIGLLFFVIPGIIAFAVDFSTGAIYISGGSSRKSEFIPSELRNMNLLFADGKPKTRLQIESIILQKTGKKIDLASTEVKVAKISYDNDRSFKSIDEVLTKDEFAAFSNKISDKTLQKIEVL